MITETIKGQAFFILQRKPESVQYAPYDRTRAFYKKMGFTKHRSEFTENPECQEELILRKNI